MRLWNDGKQGASNLIVKLAWVKMIKYKEGQFIAVKVYLLFAHSITNVFYWYWLIFILSLTMLQCEDEEAIFPCGHYDLNRYQWLGFSSARPRHMRENRSVGFSHNYDHCTLCSVNITPPTSSIKLMKSMSRREGNKILLWSTGQHSSLCFIVIQSYVWKSFCFQ